MKRIVSFVPSWTETLIEAGANVVGRTRFCIHPSERVQKIEAIGGTKSFDIEKLRALSPDVIIMDREENTREMYELAKVVAPVVATHVSSVHDVARDLRLIAEALEPQVASELQSMATRFDAVLSRPALVLHNGSGVLQEIKGRVHSQMECVYVIWREPWMCVSQSTFIASMLEQAGLSKLWSPKGPAKYPTLDQLPADKLILLSSEPYPFAKKIPDLPNENVALVDGESFSWFGIRALRFLEAIKRP